MPEIMPQSDPKHPLAAMFEISDQEKQQLSELSPAEQKTFLIFRDSFALSQGAPDVQAKLLRAIQEDLDPEVKRLFNQEDIPSFLKEIEAPRKQHVGIGLRRRSEVQDQARTNGLRQAWSDWLREQQRPSPANPDLVSLEQFVDRDRDYSQDGRASLMGGAGSFLREIVVHDTVDTVVQPEFRKLIQSWRIQLEPFKDFYLKHSKGFRELAMGDLQETLGSWEDAFIMDPSTQIDTSRGITSEMAILKEHFNISDTIRNPEDLPSQELIVSLYGLIKSWEEDHPGESFFP